MKPNLYETTTTRWFNRKTGRVKNEPWSRARHGITCYEVAVSGDKVLVETSFSVQQWSEPFLTVVDRKDLTPVTTELGERREDLVVVALAAAVAMGIWPPAQTGGSDGAP